VQSNANDQTKLILFIQFSLFRKLTKKAHEDKQDKTNKKK